MGVFASSGSNLPALQDGGASVVAVPEPENDERNLKVGALAHGLPGVHNYGDVHDSDIERHAWNPRSRGVSAIVAACNANGACKSGYQWPPGPARSDDSRHTRAGERSGTRPGTPARRPSTPHGAGTKHRGARPRPTNSKARGA
jgi:hypothetical protein